MRITKRKFYPRVSSPELTAGAGEECGLASRCLVKSRLGPQNPVPVLLEQNNQPIRVGDSDIPRSACPLEDFLRV